MAPSFLCAFFLLLLYYTTLFFFLQLLRNFLCNKKGRSSREGRPFCLRRTRCAEGACAAPLRMTHCANRLPPIPSPTAPPVILEGGQRPTEGSEAEMRETLQYLPAQILHYTAFHWGMTAGMVLCKKRARTIAFPGGGRGTACGG